MPPRLRQRPVAKLDQVRPRDLAHRIPVIILVRRKITPVVLGVEFPREEGQPSVRQDHDRGLEQVIYNLHVEVARTERLIDDLVVPALVGLEQHDVRAQHLLRDGRVLIVHPVRARDREGSQRGEEVVIHVVEDQRVRVEGEDSRVVGQVERVELGEALGPRCIALVRGEKLQGSEAKLGKCGLDVPDGSCFL